jgi:hypothetical protein
MLSCVYYPGFRLDFLFGNKSVKSNRLIEGKSTINVTIFAGVMLLAAKKIFLSRSHKAKVR